MVFGVGRGICRDLIHVFNSDSRIASTNTCGTVLIPTPTTYGESKRKQKSSPQASNYNYSSYQILAIATSSVMRDDPRVSRLSFWYLPIPTEISNGFIDASGLLLPTRACSCILPQLNVCFFWRNTSTPILDALPWPQVMSTLQGSPNPYCITKGLVGMLESGYHDSTLSGSSQPISNMLCDSQNPSQAKVAPCDWLCSRWIAPASSRPWYKIIRPLARPRHEFILWHVEGKRGIPLRDDDKQGVDGNMPICQYANLPLLHRTGHTYRHIRIRKITFLCNGLLAINNVAIFAAYQKASRQAGSILPIFFANHATCTSLDIMGSHSISFDIIRCPSSQEDDPAWSGLLVALGVCGGHCP